MSSLYVRSLIMMFEIPVECDTSYKGNCVTSITINVLVTDTSIIMTYDIPALYVTLQVHEQIKETYLIKCHSSCVAISIVITFKILT